MQFAAVEGELPQPLPKSGLSLYTQVGDSRGFDLCYTNVIIPTAKEYDFYPLHFVAFLKLMMPNFYMYINEKGWALVIQGINPDESMYVEIKYILVYPQFRQKGFLRDVHNECVRTGKRVVVTTERSGMVRALHALGYECYGITSDKKELQFKYTKHLNETN